MGAGIPLLPSAFQSAGLVSSSVFTIVVAILAGLAATMLAEVTKQATSSGGTEYSTLCKEHLGPNSFRLVQVILNLSLLSLNLVSILLTIQVMDWTIVRIFGCTCGLVLLSGGDTSSTAAGFDCVCFAANQCSRGDSPFQSDMVIGVGFLVVLALVVPLSFLNLENNIVVQVISVLAQVAIMVQWMVVFFAKGFPNSSSSPKEVHSSSVIVITSQGSMLSQVVLNFAFAMTVPSWMAVRRTSSSVNTVVWSSIIFSTVFFLAVGILGALSFPSLDGESILTAIDRASNGSVLSEVSVYLFPLIAVASSIPVFCIIVRDNLLESKLCRRRGWANLWAVVLPWILVIPLTAGNSVFNAVTTYTSILFLIPINFIIPVWLYYAAVLKKKKKSACCSDENQRCRHQFELFSLKYPRLAKRIPRIIVEILDREPTPAAEHFALPKHSPLGLKRVISVTILALFGVMALFSFVSSILQSALSSVVVLKNTTC